jgi:hypothetical protein
MLFLLFLMIVVPQGHQVLKYLLLGIYILQLAFIAFNKDTINLNKSIFISFLFYAFIGLLFGCYGILMGNPGATAIMKLTIFYLFISMFFVMGINNIEIFKKINSIIIYSAIFLAIYIFITILNTNGFWPDWLYYDISGKYASHGVQEDSLKLRGRLDIGFSSLPSFLFIQPYLFTLLLVEKRNNKNILWTAFILSTLIMILGGSRILIIISLMIPILIIIYLKFFSRNSFVKSINFKKIIFIPFISVVFVIIILIPFGLRLDAYLFDMLRGFLPYELTNIVDGGYTESAFKDMEIIPNRRITQFWILLSNWFERPFFGYGSGSVGFMKNGELYLRSSIEPWKYELTYLAFLNQWGLIGLSTYVFGILFTFRKLIRIYNNSTTYGPYALAIFFGSFSFLIGSSINPYITRFDSLYVIFLPIAIVNMWYLSGKINSMTS